MSVFFKNTCDFNNCHKNYNTLPDLITHIEHDHLDFDPLKIEQMEEDKPESLPFSYVLKFSHENLTPIYECKEEISYVNEAVIQDVDDIAANEVVTAFNNNYIDCDFKEKKARNEKRLSKDEICEFLGSNRLFTFDDNMKKPFACNMRGCEKRYKNVNGIKYHYKNYHKMLIPTFKKSLLKPKPCPRPSKPKIDRPNLHPPPYNFNSIPPPDFTYQNIPRIPQHESCEVIPNEYFYKCTMSTSDIQVPLPNNASFNYYNIADVNGDIEDFSGKNSGYFIPSFDTF